MMMTIAVLPVYATLLGCWVLGMAVGGTFYILNHAANKVLSTRVPPRICDFD